MKNTRFLAIAFVLIFSSVVLQAQTIKIDTTQISFENGIRPCLSAQVDPDQNIISNAWANFLKKSYKIKLKGLGLFSNSEVLKAEDIILLPVTDKRMNLYTKVRPLATGSQINVFASYGYDMYIGQNSFPNEFKALGVVLQDFLLKFLNEYYGDNIKATSKEIKSLTKEKVKYMKKIDKNEKKIFKLSNDIAVANATLNTSNVEAIKTVQNVSKYSSEKVALENETATKKVRVQLIDTELLQLNTTLDNLVQKQSRL